MGFRNRDRHGEESGVPGSLGDALLFTTMCIIGFPVDVHVKDGSIYSGIFHTACVENDYGIVLKKARMTKKGNQDANVASGDLIETLVVLSEDLVQVVAKGILLPADSVACNVTGNDVWDVMGSIPSLECAENGVKMKISNETNTDRMQISRTRQVGDGRSQGKQLDYEGKSDFHKEETAHEVPGSGSSCELTIPLVNDAVDACFTQSNAVEATDQEIASKLLPNGAHSDRPASSVVKQNNHCQESSASDDNSCSSAISFGVSTSGTSFVEVTTESRVSSSSTPIEMVTTKSSSLNSKELKCQTSLIAETSPVPTEIDELTVDASDEDGKFVIKASLCCEDRSDLLPDLIKTLKALRLRTLRAEITTLGGRLNPGAKVFCPAYGNHRSVTPPAVPTAPNVAYLPDSFSMVPIASAQPEVEISPFVPRSSLPVKFLPYGNLVAGNGVSESQFSPSFIGHVGSRTQPNRYAGQQYSIQSGSAYTHPNSQSVMVGRSGHLVYMHPVSHDVNQSVAVFSQVSTHPLLIPHQGHLPKHQGLNTN
ncbi:hypothetical protein U1Q18_024075 [Sarracenia purpurea var. burkii]